MKRRTKKALGHIPGKMRKGRQKHATLSPYCVDAQGASKLAPFAKGKPIIVLRPKTP